ncbi:type IV pilus assembly protein FimV [Undibacterium fentianense]|uniref:FimV N-terminal domain-containing protein n=1 Tax=Undibacterium fentianense TaxID=2828728 RepID=A0A941DXA8_9BURK|nr:hypothetical protein [Undibacterium fentianense]MBR7798445.1 hypothetical protein [Undibacterium fentianense]
MSLTIVLGIHLGILVTKGFDWGKIIERQFRQFVLAGLFASISLMLAGGAFALGFGEFRVRSALGQSLLVHADLIGMESDGVNPSCLRAKVVNIDGVFIANAMITIHQNQKQRALTFSTRQAINEPAINLIVDIQCETQLHREFSILLDPIESHPQLSSIGQDESPFGKKLKASAKPDVESATQFSDQKLKQNKPSESQSPANPKQNRIDVAAKSTELKRSRASAKLPKDVLKLSDEIVMPALPQGLKMSDVLSTDSGHQLVQNMEELRAAQAKMAAILRDEPVEQIAKAVAPVNANPELLSLKQETEQLRKQNLADKAALQQLQNRAGFDYWMIALALISILAIGVILFLLVYIRKNLHVQNPSWWEDEDANLPKSENIDDVINNLQSNYDSASAAGIASSSPVSKRNSVGSHNLAEQSKDVASLNPAIAENSGFQRTPTLEETNSSIFNFFAPRGNSVKVEEISDVTQEAEFWISMNDPHRAIEILAAQEELEHPDSPVPWLFLLDLYRTVHEKAKYDLLRDRFIVFFNANIPEYDADLTQIPSRHLEDFPHLMQKICDSWGANGIIQYLESLLVDDREGKRAGFDLPVYRDILMLLGIAHEIERIVAMEGPVAAIKNEENAPSSNDTTHADPLAEAEFGTIEFETIDFTKSVQAK